MIARILLVAVAAGIIAGAFVTLAQAVKVVPLIIKAETYESTAPAPGAAANKTTANTNTDHHKNSGIIEHSHGGGHSHGDGDEWAPEDGFERIAYTFLSNLLLGIGFSLVLTAAIVFAGVDMSLRTGILWGLAGFAVFAVSPAISLPPEMPGMVTPDLAVRHIWWLATVTCGAIGLALAVFSQSIVFKTLGLGLIAVPHIIGAPHIDLSQNSSNVPAELATQFVMATLFSTGLFWIVLGASVGGLLQRYGKTA